MHLLLLWPAQQPSGLSEEAVIVPDENVKARVSVYTNDPRLVVVPNAPVVVEGAGDYPSVVVSISLPLKAKVK